MLTTQKIKLDFTQRGIRQQVYAVQGDSESRCLEIALYESGTAWPVPAGASVVLRYRKPDGTGGLYDTLPNGDPAWTSMENIIKLILAPQVLAVAGFVDCQAAIIQGDACLGSFCFSLIVEQDPSFGAVESEGYWNWSKFIQGPSAYEVAVSQGFEGSEEEWLQSLIGPVGPTGKTGDKGEKGDKGDPGGPAGPAGKSAYAYAQDGGYTGTEEEFAAKLADSSSGIHIGAEPPTGEDVDVWIDTDEEAPKSGGGVDVTAEVGQTIVVEEVDADGKPVKWKAADYQPRTHYRELVELLPETTVQYSEEVGGYTFDSNLTFTEGETYFVKWNGTQYTCVAWSISEDLGDGSIYTTVVLGTRAPVGGIDTGEPFVIAVIDGFLQAIVIEPQPQVTVSISQYQYQKIPVEYLPAPVHWIDAVQVDGAYTQITVTPKQTQEAINAGCDVRLRIRYVDNNGNVWVYRLPCVMISEYRGLAYQLVFNGKIDVLLKEGTVRLVLNTSAGLENIDEAINLPWVVYAE